MSEATFVDIGAWVESVHNDPARYLERQATEVLLNALGMVERLGSKIFLKRGALMGIVYGSPRQTADLDFTTSLQPTLTIARDIRDQLDAMIPRAAARLGYPGIVCRVQSIAHRPRSDHFADANFPALKIKVGYAPRGSLQERLLDRRRCANVVELDISFNEAVGAVKAIRLGRDGATIRVYSLPDLIAEKLRALLQQVTRNRYRRQDVYDIAHLLRHYHPSAAERAHLLALFRRKCASRHIEADDASLSDPEVVWRAKADWNTLALELGEVPPFDDCFQSVESLYRSLPWRSARD